MHVARPRSSRGFTLVELLIVVVILGILAAIAIPQFANSTRDAQVTSLQTNLNVLRRAAEYYKFQHASRYPGYPAGGGSPDPAVFVAQLTQASKSDGSTAVPGTAGFDLGPYLKESLPVNPVNGLSTVKVLDDATAFPTAADGATGWIFKPLTGKLRANSIGTTASGTAYFDF
ncbi:MAG: type II secretion system protein [Planctomycetes bacterium]|nr:type II secretion system protein [Planctomycetota bacterium]